MKDITTAKDRALNQSRFKDKYGREYIQPANDCLQLASHIEGRKKEYNPLFKPIDQGR